VPEAHLEPQAALATGYGQSKWVAETLLKRTSELTGIHTVIARVGQLSGDSMSGGWTTKEWFPAMLRSSQVLGCIPQHTLVSLNAAWDMSEDGDIDRCVSW